MQHESFEDEEVAVVLNRDFIAVKVDKEERPDLDAVYMAVCQAFTGQGGWPTTIFITPEQKPFFAGTYFPKESGSGSLGLMELLKAAKEAWDKDPVKLAATGDEVIRLLSGSRRNIRQEPDENPEESGSEPPVENRAKSSDWQRIAPVLLEKAESYFANAFDGVWGGFGSAPKFPAAHNLLFLMKLHEKKHGITEPEPGKLAADSHELAMVEKTLQQMYAGGMYDHVGFGFCRYSTDERWLIPHFEKMLYDNALLCLAYTECWRHTRKPFYRRVAEEILDYVIREMRSPEGGFYAAQDADSEGEEGKYYAFLQEEVKSVLGEDAGTWFCETYGITSEGNFEGKSVPNLIRVLAKAPERIPGLVENAEWSAEAGLRESRMRRQQDDMKRKLYEYRLQRVKLRTDDKILTSWNCLMIAAFARACKVFGRKEYLAVAQEAESFLREKLVKRDGGLRVRYRNGEAAGDGFLNDYAFYQWALLELLDASHRVAYLQRALEVQNRMIREFWDSEGGGFYFTGEEQEKLIFRPKETYDGAMPCGNSAAALAMIRLNHKMGETGLRRMQVEEQLSFLAASARSHPASMAFGLMAFLEH